MFLAKQILKNLLQKGFIRESQHEEGEFILPIFFVPKTEDAFRIILNLKSLNENMPLFILNGDRNVYLDLDGLDLDLDLIVTWQR